MSTIFDAAIIGAGPAGASCAIWLKLMGLAPVLLEAGQAAGGLQRQSPYRNDWLAVVPGHAGTDIARAVDDALVRQAVDLRRRFRVAAIAGEKGGFTLSDGHGDVVGAARIVIATGTRPATGGLPDAPGFVFGPGADVFNTDFRGLRVAILGGGDNALENYAFARLKGAAQVRIFARSLKARRVFLETVDPADVTLGPYDVAPDERRIAGERFDLVLVMYGWEPVVPPIEGAPLRRIAQDYLWTAPMTAETSRAGIYAIGDVANRMHPCVATALADGVTAAKAIEAEDNRAAQVRLRARFAPA